MESLVGPLGFSFWCCPQQDLFPWSAADNLFFAREQQPSLSVAPQHLPVPQQQEDGEEIVKQTALIVPSGHTQEKWGMPATTVMIAVSKTWPTTAVLVNNAIGFSRALYILLYSSDHRQPGRCIGRPRRRWLRRFA
jgi:hypothetical protein